MVIGDLEQSSKNASQQRPTHELITSQGGEAIFVEVNVLKAASVETLVEEAVAKFGRLDM